jgi:signal peptidase I
MIDKLLKVAHAYVGYLEKESDTQLEDFTANAGSGNYTVFGRWYGTGWNGQPWCAMFVSYCADVAGISASIIPKHASCAYGVSWFKRMNRWHDRYTYDPVPGDIIYFSNDGETPAHVGIVNAIKDGRVYTIEGNTSGGSELIANGGAVAQKSYLLTYKKILGYGNPAYVELDNEPADWERSAVEKALAMDIIGGDQYGNLKLHEPLTLARQLVVLEKLGVL